MPAQHRTNNGRAFLASKPGELSTFVEHGEPFSRLTNLSRPEQIFAVDRGLRHAGVSLVWRPVGQVTIREARDVLARAAMFNQEDPFRSIRRTEAPEVQDAVASLLLAIDGKIREDVFGKAGIFFVGERLLAGNLPREFDRYAELVATLVGPPFVDPICAQLSNGWTLFRGESRSVLATRQMRLWELLDRVQCDPRDALPIDLRELFRKHKKSGFPNDSEIADCKIQLARPSGRLHATPHGDQFQWMGTREYRTDIGDELRVCSTILSDTPVGLLFTFKGHPLWATSFLPESWSEASIVQSQSVICYPLLEGGCLGKALHERQLPIRRHVSLRTLMLELSAQILEEWGFSKIRVPNSSQENIDRVPGRYAIPETMRRYYDEPAVALGFQPEGDGFIAPTDALCGAVLPPADLTLPNLPSAPRRRRHA